MFSLNKRSLFSQVLQVQDIKGEAWGTRARQEGKRWSAIAYKILRRLAVRQKIKCIPMLLYFKVNSNYSLQAKKVTTEKKKKKLDLKTFLGGLNLQLNAILQNTLQLFWYF